MIGRFLKACSLSILVISLGIIFTIGLHIGFPFAVGVLPPFLCNTVINNYAQCLIDNGGKYTPWNPFMECIGQHNLMGRVHGCYGRFDVCREYGRYTYDNDDAVDMGKKIQYCTANFLHNKNQEELYDVVFQSIQDQNSDYQCSFLNSYACPLGMKCGYNGNCRDEDIPLPIP